MENRLFRFCYFNPRKKGRAQKPHEIRGGAAFSELAGSLYPLGYQWGGLLLNSPPSDDAPPSCHRKGASHQIDTSHMGPGDLLVTTTRPPLDDEEHGDRLRVERGRTTLEDQVFRAARRYFQVCAGSHVKLARKLAVRLPEAYATRADLEFRQHSSRIYKSWNDGRGWKKVPQGAPGRTAAYLLRVDHLWKDGPGMLAAFGMGGTETLVWACRLRREFSHLLREPAFVMAELEPKPLPARPTNLDFADDWKVEIVLHHRL